MNHPQPPLRGRCPEYGGQSSSYAIVSGWNSTPTIPHIFSKRKDSGFPYGCADAAATDGQRGSNVYEVNPWLWEFGLGKPRLRGLTIEETTERKDAVTNAWQKRAAATPTVRYRKANPA